MFNRGSIFDISDGKGICRLFSRSLLILPITEPLNIFLTKPWDDKEVMKNLPKPLWQKHEMLTTLNRVPKLWKRFKLKIKTFLDELDKY